ncbi:MAG TPA: hypothetical protein VFG07_04380 [Thermoplasmata archaeon]|nr:hypothetical protein [Thermoplasmata archaeon]
MVAVKSVVIVIVSALVVLSLVGVFTAPEASAGQTATQSRDSTSAPACVPCPDKVHCVPYCNPPPPPPPVTVSFYVFQGYGQISFGGTTYSDGGSASVTQYSTIPIAPVNVANNFQFVEWVIDLNGVVSTNTVTNPSIPIPGAGSISMVLEYSTQISWAGYVVTPHSSSITYTAASGAFQLPSSIAAWNGCQYSAQGCQSDEYMGFWIGIGGVLGSGLWQAGAFVDFNVILDTYTVSYFDEFIPASGTPIIKIVGVYLASAGDTFTDSISIAAAGGQYTYTASVSDTTDSQATPFSDSKTESSLVDERTVEWIAEDPCASGSYTPIRGSCSSFSLLPQVTSTSFTSFSYTPSSGPVLHSIEGDVEVFWAQVGFYYGSNPPILYSESLVTQPIPSTARSFSVNPSYTP